MKTVETINYQNTTLTILVQVDEHSKAHVEYFVNGYQVTDWGQLRTIYKNLFNALADEECKRLNAVKWSY